MDIQFTSQRQNVGITATVSTPMIAPPPEQRLQAEPSPCIAESADSFQLAPAARISSTCPSDRHLKPAGNGFSNTLPGRSTAGNRSCAGTDGQDMPPNAEVPA